MIDEWHVRARSFGAVARRYDTFRPAPPREADELFGDLHDARVLELAAGTGLVTRTLERLGAVVTALEPDAEMRAVLNELSPEVTVVGGVAEVLPFGDASFDVVMASSAWHWFDQPVATLECARVLAPQGTLVLSGNSLDTSIDWAAALGALRDSGDQRYGADVASQVPNDGPFRFEDTRVCRYQWPRTVDEVVGLLGTYSGVVVRPEAEQAALEAEARAIVAPHVNNGQLVLPMSFRVFRFTKTA